MTRIALALVLVAFVTGCPATRRSPARTPADTATRPTPAPEGRPDPYAWNVAVRQFVAGQRPQLQSCWERELRRVEELAASGAYRNGEEVPNLAGALILVVGFDGAGRVEGARTEEDSLQNPAVAKCMLEHVARWEVAPPPDAEGVEIEIPFEFSVMGP